MSERVKAINNLIESPYWISHLRSHLKTSVFQLGTFMSTDKDNIDHGEWSSSFQRSSTSDKIGSQRLRPFLVSKLGRIETNNKDKKHGQMDKDNKEWKTNLL